MNESTNQGSVIIEEVTDVLEEVVLCELARISELGGELGSMETGYRRGKIQDESMYYEQRKHDGSWPIIGVNTFINPHQQPEPEKIELSRSTEKEKRGQIKRLNEFHEHHRESSPHALQQIRESAIRNENIFEKLVDAVRYCSLGQICDVLYEVGGQYRRNM